MSAGIPEDRDEEFSSITVDQSGQHKEDSDEDQAVKDHYQTILDRAYNIATEKKCYGHGFDQFEKKSAERDLLILNMAVITVEDVSKLCGAVVAAMTKLAKEQEQQKTE